MEVLSFGIIWGYYMHLNNESIESTSHGLASGHGNGSGDGYRDGSGDGYGLGWGSGYGNGSGSGFGDGTGFGSGNKNEGEDDGTGKCY